MIEISSDVPLPAPPNRRVYPFDEMEIGQSFAAPLDKTGSVQAIATRKSRDGKRFTTRAMGGELRVWRTA